MGLKGEEIEARLDAALPGMVTEGTYRALEEVVRWAWGRGCEDCAERLDSQEDAVLYGIFACEMEIQENVVRACRALKDAR